MRMRVFVVTVALLLATGTFAQSAPKEVCDSTCLKHYVDRYLDAMMADNPSLDLFTRDCRFTENGVRLPLGGEGLWYSMSGEGTYKFYIPDVETRQIAFIGTVKEGGRVHAKKTPNAKPAKVTLSAIALRLKINDSGKICEAEQIVIRPKTNLFGTGGNNSRFPPVGESVEKMGAPNKIFTEVIPKSKRLSREEYIKIANYYFAGLQRNNGKGYYPFTNDCDRYENGIKTTNIPMKDPATGKMEIMGCKEQFEKTLKGVVTRIRDRRFVAVDRKHGIVFAFTFFDHVYINWTWEVAELFKIQNRKIRRIEAVFQRCPYGMNSGWSTYEQGMSEAIQSIR